TRHNSRQAREFELRLESPRLLACRDSRCHPNVRDEIGPSEGQERETRYFSAYWPRLQGEVSSYRIHSQSRQPACSKYIQGLQSFQCRATKRQPAFPLIRLRSLFRRIELTQSQMPAPS